MSAILKTEAIVLKSMKYRETSKIVTLYTRAFGKVRAVAKGARHANSTFGSSLEPMSYILLVLYKKEHRDLHLISQSELVKPFPRLTGDLDAMAAGLSIIELMDKVSHDEERNDKLFQFLVEVFTTLNAATPRPQNVLYSFEIRLAGILGFQPTFDRCMVCNRPNGSENSSFVMFHVSKGGPLCALHAGTPGLKVKVSLKSLSILGDLEAADIEDAGDIEVLEPHREEIEGLLLGFLRFHVDGLQNLQSERVFSRVLAHRREDNVA